MNKWEKYKIEDVCDFIGGSQPPKSSFINTPQKGYVRLVQTRDFKTDKFPTYIPINSTSKFFSKEDIIIGRYGPPIFQIFKGRLSGAYNVALMKAVPHEKILNEFLYYFLTQKNIFEYVDKLSARTGGQTGVDLISLYKYPILLPSLSEQKNIADVLSALDSKIDLNNQINSELEALAKTIYDYWFVQFDFPDENGKPYKSSGGKMVWNEELKREIPEGWKAKTLDYLGDIVGGSTPSREVSEYFSKNGIPWITPKDLSLNIGNKFIKRGEIDVSAEGRSAASLNILPQGTVLMSSRAPVGYLAIASNDVTTNQGFKSFVPKAEITTEFIYYTIKNLLPVIENNASGSTFKEVSGSVLKTINCLVPFGNTISSYTKLIKPIFNQQQNLEEENQKLTELRDWLLPMLMNGQLKIYHD
jgi:type I restriction enzyme S subunit